LVELIELDSILVYFPTFIDKVQSVNVVEVGTSLEIHSFGFHLNCKSIRPFLQPGNPPPPQGFTLMFFNII
jgi:hypothetical protein